MKILLQQVQIADPQVPENGQTMDVLIDQGKIVSMAPLLEASADKIFSQPGALLAPGFVDVFAHAADPGLEYRETLLTAAAAAQAGGYTRLMTLPNTQPVADQKSIIDYQQSMTRDLGTRIHPIGAITQKIAGQQLAEMYDMRQAGAVAFSDGFSPVQSPGLLLKALQYVKAFDGVLIQVPIEQSIGGRGLVHEGLVSTRMGLPGIPELAETSIIKRDLDLLAYTGSKLHITGISSANSVALVRSAKANGLSVTCSVTPYHLHFTDADLAQYNTNLKVNPPLRTAEDKAALLEGLMDGTIDTVASHHFPHDWDHKTCEFEAAAFGMSGLETTIAATISALPALSPDRLVEIFSVQPRKIFGLPSTHVAKGEVAELTLLHPEEHSLLTTGNTQSKSTNNAFTGTTLKGKILGTIFHQKSFFA